LALDQAEEFTAKQQLTINELQNEIDTKDRTISMQRTELCSAREKIDALRRELEATEALGEKAELWAEQLTGQLRDRGTLVDRLEAERNALLEAFKLVLKRAIPRAPTTYQVDMSEVIKGSAGVNPSPAF
jgi:uncharacterized protein YigA (DUF484 family)